MAGSEDILFQRYGRYGITKIWMDDILPCRAYLRHWWVPQVHVTTYEVLLCIKLYFFIDNWSRYKFFISFYAHGSWIIKIEASLCNSIGILTTNELTNVLKIMCSVLAAKNLSDMAYDNFLDHTFLGDRRTTIREYLTTSGSGIMEEEPPEDLKHRYGGWYKPRLRKDIFRILILLIWDRTR